MSTEEWVFTGCLLSHLYLERKETCVPSRNTTNFSLSLSLHRKSWSVPGLPSLLVGRHPHDRCQKCVVDSQETSVLTPPRTHSLLPPTLGPVQVWTG